MCVPAVIVVVIVTSGFRDRMHCTSLQLVIAHPICPAALDFEVMISHIGFCGRWPIRLSSSSVELGIGVWSTVTVFPKEFVLLFLLGILRSGHGYRRDNDTWGEEKERTRIRIVTHTEGGWEGRRRVSSSRRYRHHGLLDCQSGTCNIRSRDRR